MNQQINAMQESIKIALDAADAATDVTSEYKRIKNEYIKAAQKVKEIHKYTTIVFSVQCNCCDCNHINRTSILNPSQNLMK